MGPAVLFICIGVLALVAWAARPRSPGVTYRDFRAGGTDVRRIFSDIGAAIRRRGYKYRRLSLKARVGVAMVCFERYCRTKGLRHRLIDTFAEHMWEMPCMKSLPDWESGKSELADFALGGLARDPLPRDFLVALESAGIRENEFEELVSNCLEIFYCSAYAGTNHIESLRSLHQVIRITSTAGVTPPPIQPFLFSRASQSDWGHRLSPDQRDAWRQC